MFVDIETIISRFKRLIPAVDECSLRIVEESAEWTAVRQDVAMPLTESRDYGAMITIRDGDGLGYAATSDLSDAGLRAALDRALDWMRLSKQRSVFSNQTFRLPRLKGRYRSATTQPFTWSIADRIEVLMNESRACKIDARVVDWQASLSTQHIRSALMTADSLASGDYVLQETDIAIPALHVTVHEGGVTQTRSWGGRDNGFCQQGGYDVLERAGFIGSGPIAAREALQLLAAPNCPSGKFDLLLMPDQLMLQIHESIGHPLELDRILGDERNYAGTSFVTLDMFGSYQYGSSLLNVTYDPTQATELASFAFDDEGAQAQRQYVIQNGILLRPLGGMQSNQRAQQIGYAFDAVATSRACAWNRPPIDRMSNLNIEPGNTTLDEMIASIEDGILMETNASWSIDDSRNKFQFGCEWGQRIRNGKRAEIVRNPNYRGISKTFWRSLAMVGDASTFEVMGTPYCGKGEPNQAIWVGHASPVCKFTGIDVFGAER